MEAGEWWERHFQDLIANERAVVARHEARAQILVGFCVAALGWSLTLLQRMSGIGWALQLFSMFALLFAVGALALIWWPLERGSFALGTIEERVWRALLGERSRWARMLGVKESSDVDLSKRVMDAARRDELDFTQCLKSTEARNALHGFMKAAVYTDLSWWLVPDDERAAERRLRLVFLWWGQRQAAYVKMSLLSVGLRSVILGIVLLTSALGLAPLGYWALLPALFLIMFLIYQNLDFS